MLRLRCKVQNYLWGKCGGDSEVYQLARAHSKQLDTSLPYAELWMGVHENGPSELFDCQGTLLSTFIAEHQDRIGPSIQLGTGKLYYLLKVLSIHKALSIQCHPDKKNAEFLHVQNPEIYKDSNHKPEMAIALTRFEALLGFRRMEQIAWFFKNLPGLRLLLDESMCWVLEPEYKQMSLEAETEGVRKVYFSVMNSDAEVVKSVFQTLLFAFENKSFHEFGSPPGKTDMKAILDVFLRLHHFYPYDVGCLSIFLMNYLILEPGEAIYLAPRLIHAYLSGDCVECMACSDNIIRAGLTQKYKDVPKLLQLLDYTPRTENELRFKPTVKCLLTSNGCVAVNMETFRPPVFDFAVERFYGPAGVGNFMIPRVTTASILIVIHGSGELRTVTGEKRVVKSTHVMQRGLVYFIFAGEYVEVRPKLTCDQPSEEILLFQARGNRDYLI